MLDKTPKTGPLPEGLAATLKAYVDAAPAGERAMIERLRAELKTTDYEPLDDAALACQVRRLPSAAASNAIENNPLDAGDFALLAMLMQERLPGDDRASAINRYHEIEAGRA